MGWFVVARFLLTSASRGPSAIAELLVKQTGNWVAGSPSNSRFACFVPALSMLQLKLPRLQREAEMLLQCCPEESLLLISSTGFAFFVREIGRRRRLSAASGEAHAQFRFFYGRRWLWYGASCGVESKDLARLTAIPEFVLAFPVLALRT